MILAVIHIISRECSPLLGFSSFGLSQASRKRHVDYLVTVSILACRSLVTPGHATHLFLFNVPSGKRFINAIYYRISDFGLVLCSKEKLGFFIVTNETRLD